MQNIVNIRCVKSVVIHRVMRRCSCMKIGVLVGLLLLLFSNISCDYDRFDPPNSESGSVPVTTMDIATLRTFYQDDPVCVVGQRSVVVSG